MINSKFRGYELPIFLILLIWLPDYTSHIITLFLGYILRDLIGD